MSKFESESDEKEQKFWNEIAELKLPLGDIFDGSKWYNINISNKQNIYIYIYIIRLNKYSEWNPKGIRWTQKGSSKCC